MESSYFEIVNSRCQNIVSYVVINHQNLFAFCDLYLKVYIWTKNEHYNELESHWLYNKTKPGIISKFPENTHHVNCHVSIRPINVAWRHLVVNVIRSRTSIGHIVTRDCLFLEYSPVMS